MNITGIIAGMGATRRPGVGVAPIQPTTITFGTVSGTFVESPTGKWGTNGSGLSALVMPASTAARIYATYNEIDTFFALIGCDTVTGVETYTGIPYGVMVSGTTGNYLYSDGAGSAISTGVGSVNGDLYGINITAAGVITAEYYRGGWTVLFTYSSNTAQKYIKADVQATNYLLNPVGFGII